MSGLLQKNRRNLPGCTPKKKVHPKFGGPKLSFLAKNCQLNMYLDSFQACVTREVTSPDGASDPTTTDISYLKLHSRRAMKIGSWSLKLPCNQQVNTAATSSTCQFNLKEALQKSNLVFHWQLKMKDLLVFVQSCRKLDVSTTGTPVGHRFYRAFAGVALSQASPNAISPSSLVVGVKGVQTSTWISGSFSLPVSFSKDVFFSTLIIQY